MTGTLLGANDLVGGKFPVLTAIVLVPAIGAVVIAVLSKRRPEFVKLVAILISAFTAALSVWMLASFETANDGFQYTS